LIDRVENRPADGQQQCKRGQQYEKAANDAGPLPLEGRQSGREP
jgi:hypothetical protein